MPILWVEPMTSRARFINVSYMARVRAVFLSNFPCDGQLQLVKKLAEQGKGGSRESRVAV